MGKYISQSDVEKRIDRAKLIQLTAGPGATEPEPDVVSEVISDAEGVVESHLRTRYTLPVPQTAQVKNLCISIAGFKFFQRRATTTEGAYAVWEKAYNDSIRFLEKVQAGKASLDVPAAEETKTNPSSSDTVLKGSSRSVFTDDKLSGY